MDDASIDRLLSMVPSSRVLEHATLKPETVETLVRVTYNRGILLADIHEHVLRNIFLLTDDEVKIVITTVKSAALYMCGQDLQTMSNETISEIRDFTEYKYKFFTNLDSYDDAT